jgi:hypothetical protein
MQRNNRSVTSPINHPESLLQPVNHLIPVTHYYNVYQVARTSTDTYLTHAVHASMFSQDPGS